MVTEPVPSENEGCGDERARSGDWYNEGVYFAAAGDGGTGCAGVFPSIGDEVVTACPISSGEGVDSLLSLRWPGN